MKTSRPVLAFLLLAAVPLAACSSGEEPAQEAEVGALPLEVTNARLVLPPVSGNPAAVYFDVANPGERNIAIRAVSVEGAQNAELHGSMEMDGKMMMDSVGQVLVEAGSTTSLESGGYHVMAFDVDPSLAAGAATMMTLTIVGGDTMTVPVEIRAAGEDR